MSFRKDINGVRAIAVLVVVLFHFGVPGFDGGFVGVDIFFVISGFLMTKIIFSSLSEGKFSFTSFYISRARRIVPALAIAVLAVLAIGWFMLPPTEFRVLGKHSGSSIGFISNFAFLREAGYFDADSHEKWLLHTWSLSVEFQFYIIYPILLVAAAKVFGLNSLRVFVLGLAALSLAASIAVSKSHPEFSFFMLPTRAWELLAGGLVFLFPLSLTRTQASMLERLGLMLIIASVVVFRAENVWPGWLALAPVLGSAALIMANRQASAVTANGVSQFLGSASYSIYLWHWPVVVLFSYYGLLSGFGWITVGILLSVALGYVSYKYLEGLASSRGRFTSMPATTVKVVALVGVVGVVSSSIYLADGYSGRSSREFRENMHDLVMPQINNGSCFYNVSGLKALQLGDAGLKCHVGEEESEFKAVIFGDSFAGHYEPFWDVVGKRASMDVLAVTTNWCYPSFTEGFTGRISDRSYSQCLYNREYVSKSFDEFDLVILAGNWGAVKMQDRLNEVIDVANAITDAGGKVVIMASPVIFDVNVKAKYERSLWLNQVFDVKKYPRSKDVIASEANRALEDAVSGNPGIIFLKRESLFNIDGIASDVTSDNVPYSVDGSHLSRYGSKAAAYSFIDSEQFNDLTALMESQKPLPPTVEVRATF